MTENEMAYCSRCPNRGYTDDIRPSLLIIDGLCHECWLAECRREELESLLP